MLLFKTKLVWKLSFNDKSLSILWLESGKTHGMFLASSSTSQTCGLTSDFKACHWIYNQIDLWYETMTYMFSLSNSKIFVSADIIENNWTHLGNCMKHIGNKNPEHYNLGYDSRTGRNSTFILRLGRRSFCIKKCNLKPTLFSVAFFELWEK